MTSGQFRMDQQELDAIEIGPDRVTPTPRLAAGVILARDTTAGPQVLLVRRRSDVGFAASAYVFPGGTLDEEDSDPAWAELLVPPAPEALAAAADEEGPTELTFVVAALRELFEETGVLLVAGREPDPEALAAWRDDLVASRCRFLDIVERAGLKLAADRLVLCARWITPEAFARRYDARFFLARAPTGVDVTAERGELVEHLWIAPGVALRRYFDYRFRLLFPTAKTLGWLERGDRVEDWRRRFLGGAIQPICPRVRRFDGEFKLVMPGEPRYEESASDE